MGMQNIQKKSYLTRVAEQMIRDLKLTPRGLEQAIALGQQPSGPQALWQEIRFKARHWLVGRNPENLGRIAGQGLHSWEASGRGKTRIWALDPDVMHVDSGPRVVLRGLAAMVLVAEAYDILYARLEEERSDPNAREERREWVRAQQRSGGSDLNS